ADVRTLTPGRDVPDVAAPDVLDRLTRADVLRNHVDRALFPLYGLEFDRPRARRAFDRPGSLAAAHHLARPGAAGFRRAPLVSRRGVPGGAPVFHRFDHARRQALVCGSGSASDVVRTD